MIRKSELADAINDLSHDLTFLSVRVNDLRNDVDKLMDNSVKVNIKPEKRGRGRPRKNTQPRDKSGKFAKK